MDELLKMVKQQVKSEWISKAIGEENGWIKHTAYDVFQDKVAVVRKGA